MFTTHTAVFRPHSLSICVPNHSQQTTITSLCNLTLLVLLIEKGFILFGVKMLTMNNTDLFYP